MFVLNCMFIVLGAFDFHVSPHSTKFLIQSYLLSCKMWEHTCGFCCETETVRVHLKTQLGLIFWLVRYDVNKSSLSTLLNNFSANSRHADITQLSVRCIFYMSKYQELISILSAWPRSKCIESVIFNSNSRYLEQPVSFQLKASA